MIVRSTTSNPGKWFYTAFFLFLTAVVYTPVLAQQDIRVQITSGLPLIPVAIPDFKMESTIADASQVKKEIYEVLCNDLDYSRVFKVVPKEHYSYIQAFDPNKIRFKDWASIQSDILLVGEMEVAAGDRIVFSIRVYDVKSEKFMFGRNFGGKKEFTRMIAHRAADELMKYFGEKPIFNTKVAFVSTRDKNNEIYMMDYDGQRERRITYNTDIDVLPSWSADNEKVLYTTYRHNNPDLFMFYLYTGKTEMISVGGANYAADWSLENDTVVFTSTKSGNAEIYTKDLKNGKEKRLTFNPAIDTTASWSPNGQEIVFTSQRSGTPQIYIMDKEGTNVRRITHDGNYHDSPAWSPDGTRIVFVSRIEGNFDIFVYNLKDNTMTKLTEAQGRNENPTWSPDGRHIIFASNRTGSSQLFSMDYDGANVKQLTSSGENKMPKWQKR